MLRQKKTAINAVNAVEMENKNVGRIVWNRNCRKKE